MNEEELNRVLRSHRYIALACGFFLLAFGVVRALTQTNHEDPLIERLLLASACFTYVFISAMTPYIRRAPNLSMAILASAIGAFLVHLAYLTSFSPNSCFTVLLATFVCSLLMHSRWSLILFLGVNLALILFLLGITPEPRVDRLFFVSTLIAVGFFTFLSQKIRMDTEYHLREATELAQSAAKSRARFLANMSHEIRTPMNGVIGMTQLLQGTQLDESQREYVKTIRLSGELLMSVINNVLDFSKADAEQIHLENIPFELSECIENSVSLISQAAADKGLKLNVQIDAQSPRYFTGDPLRLRQILINLLGNAIKFTDAGEVALSVTAVRDGPDCQLLCEVTDTGEGIAADAIGSLFKEFTQADSSTTRKYGGTGLGLAISRHLVELMGGRLEVKSQEGIGSTFSFIIQMQVTEEIVRPDESFFKPVLTEGDAAFRAPDVSFDKIRVLLAEDNKVNQLVASKILRTFGLNVDIAVNGQEALDAMRAKDYDLVFMDLQMPKMDGLEVTRSIRMEQPLHPCKIVALTANAFPADREACIAAGMDDYLAKPIQIDTLKAILDRLIPEIIERIERFRIKVKETRFSAESGQ